MPISYDVRQHLVAVEITDDMTAPDILAFYERLAADPRFQPGTPFLVDARGVTSAPPAGPLEATALAAVRAVVFAVSTKSAALVSSEWMYGIVRQWATMSEPGNLVTRPFFDELEARRWLGVPPDA